jgi:hypothetical protein
MQGGQGKRGKEVMGQSTHNTTSLAITSAIKNRLDITTLHTFSLVPKIQQIHSFARIPEHRTSQRGSPSAPSPQYQSNVIQCLNTPASVQKCTQDTACTNFEMFNSPSNSLTGPRCSNDGFNEYTLTTDKHSRIVLGIELASPTVVITQPRWSKCKIQL